MKQVTMRGSQLEVSTIALGAWGLGSDFYGTVDFQSVVDTLHAAVDCGINMVDTAPNYGNSEEVLGKALEGIRDRVVVATKCGCLKYAGGSYKLLTPVSMRQQLEESLRRLKTDYIDLYQIHYPDKNNSMDLAYEAMNKFVEEGKIRAWGVCNHSVPELLKASDFGAVSTQIQYSISHRACERDVLPVADANGMAGIAYGTMIGGLLSGKYREAKSVGTTDRRPMFYTEFQERNWEKSKKLIQAVEKMAEEKDVSMVNIAVAWALANRHVSIVLTGAKSPEQIQMNALAAEVTLSESETAELNAAWSA